MTCSLDILLPPLCLEVQSSILSRSFWTSAHLSSTSRSIPPRFLTPFGLQHASPPPQGPFHHAFSLLLDFLCDFHRFNVQSDSFSRPFWTSTHLPSASTSIPPRFLAPPRKKGGLQSNPPVPIRQFQPATINPPVPTNQSGKTVSIRHQPIPPSKAPAISATSESGTRTYLPSGINHFPIGLSAPVLTASTANFFPATQKNIIAASIAPSGQI